MSGAGVADSTAAAILNFFNRIFVLDKGYSLGKLDERSGEARRSRRQVVDDGVVRTECRILSLRVLVCSGDPP